MNDLRTFRHIALITTLEGLASLAFLLSLPKSAGNPWLFGYSFSRAVLILGMLCVCLALIGVTLGLWKNPGWMEKLRSLPEAAMDRYLRAGLAFLSAVVAVLSFFLFAWVVTENEFYLGYFTRFGPILVFLALVSLQAFGMAVWMLPGGEKPRWIWSAAVGVMLVLAQGWSVILRNQLENAALVLTLIAGALYLQAMFRRGFSLPLKAKAGWAISILFVVLMIVCQLIFIPKRYLIYTPVLSAYSPLILVGFAALTHLLDGIIAHFNKGVWTRRILYLALLVLVLFAGRQYVLAGRAHADAVNTTYAPYDDESAFMEFAMQVRESGFRYTGWRNQMPVYAYIQAWFYRPGMSLDDFFGVGKDVNIGLSLVSLAAVFWVAWRFLPLYQAVSFTLLISFGLYVYKSGYILVELLYYALAFFAYVLLCIVLTKPSIKLGALAGVVLGVAHLTKASVLPGLILFLAVYLWREGAQAFADWRRGQPPRLLWEGSKPRLASLGVLVLVYLLVLTPYGLESQREYGGFFYNVNNDFLWYDSYGEALEGPPGNEHLSPMARYFRDHDLADIRERIRYGLHWQMENIRYQYGFFNYPVFLTMFLCAAFVLNVKRGLQLIREQRHVLLFAGLYFAAYFSLCIWYSPIANLPRFLYAMYLPLAFSLYVAANKLVENTRQPLIKMTQLAILMMTAIDIWHVASHGPFFRDFGS